MQLYKSKLSESILSNCNKFGNNTIVESIYGKKVTGNEYKNLAFSYAKKLQETGIKYGDSVVIFIKDLTKFSYIALAVILLGAKLIIVEPEMGEQVLKNKLKFIKPNLVIIEGILYYLLKTPIIKNISKIRKYNSLLDYSQNIIVEYKKYSVSKEHEIIDWKTIDPNTESLVVFTGGTTGNPKGVVHTLDSLETMFERITKIIGTKSKIFYADLPHFILIGISLGTKVIIGENKLKDNKFLETLEKYQIDTTFSPPYRYLNILNENKQIPNCITHICLGSAPIYKTFLKKLYKNITDNGKVSCIYGMTEILPIAYIDGREKLAKKVKGDLLGKVFTDININISHDNELEVSGKGLFKKYLGNENIINHKTGDLIEYKEGVLIMKGRKKDMILRKDYNIYPSLYEPIINSIEGVIDSALVGVFDKELEDEKIILFVEGENLSIKDIGNKLKSGQFSIDKWAIPDEIILCKIPRTGRQNKIDKNYLRNNYQNIGK